MSLEIVGFLILFPLVPAALIWVVRNARFRNAVTFIGSAVIIVASIALAAMHLVGSPVYISFDSTVVSWILFAVDMLMCLIVLVQAIRHRRWLALVLALIQASVVCAIEFTVAHDIHVANGLYVDSLSAIMVLMIGVIGSLICIYAVGYMRDFASLHEGDERRQPLFFSLMFVFLSAMFLIVLSDNLSWMFAGWEVTTVCSFLLIGYTRTETAINNCFRQVYMNLIGGIAFGAAILLVGFSQQILSLSELVAMASSGALVSAALMLPVALLAVSGLIKSAQAPFHSWLLGAMVAPTPTSALLHSSTMVKAGVFLLVKLSPCLGMNFPGMMVVFVGGATFLFTSLMAVAQTDAKRVLAYSTVANLGLVALCAGIGTVEGVWAATFLMVFHAATKAMLFMCVGTAEHHIGSRDIECMDNLFVRMPRLARIMGAGMLCMFVAPFGMLVSKWATMVSVVDAGNLIALMLVAFGSAPTFFFWAKWLGKISAVGPTADNVEGGVHRCEWVAVGTCIALSLALCVAMPAASSLVVTPYADMMFTAEVVGVNATIGPEPYLIFTAALTVVLMVLYLAMFNRDHVRRRSVYMAGISTDPDKREFMGAMGMRRVATTANWTIVEWFSERVLDRPACIVCIVLICAGLVASALGGGALL